MNRRIIPALITALALVFILLGCVSESVASRQPEDSAPGSVAIPIIGEKYDIAVVPPEEQDQAAAVYAVAISEENTLCVRELADGTGICWYTDGDEVCCAYRKNSGGWKRFLTEGSPPPSYRESYDAELFSDLFGHSGFYIMALRGAAYYAQDYYYFDSDGELALLFTGTHLDVIADFNGDGENELIWFYHGGREAIYFYTDGDDILGFDVIEALLARFDDWSDAVADPLSIKDGTIQLICQKGDDPFDATIRFTHDEMIVFKDSE